MSEIMRPVKFRTLLEWIVSEYRERGSIFGIDERHFYYKQDKRNFKLGNESYETLVGPAAGPHTQCAQNLISAYLSGARYFELKTVQILDEIEVGKPCIEAENEGYNTEWSTELKVEEAYREYVKAWVILHFLKSYQELSEIEDSGFIFNMSVGYDLEGIKSRKIDKFINDLKEAGSEEYFKKCLLELREFCNSDKELAKYQSVADSIPSAISSSVTLSTMHGCPPEDQEAICSYLLKEKKLTTYVKLNPTLLGYEYVKQVFAETGYRLPLKREVFEKDLQYGAAKTMIRKLMAVAKREGMTFGVKLTNTLPVINRKGILPGDEMYMSGKSLYPLTVALAEKLSHDLGTDLEISYCGGAEYGNIRALAETGIQPVTMATNLLKPGGYSRINQICRSLEELEIPEKRQIKKLEELAVTATMYSAKHAQKSGSVKIGEKLPLYDCTMAGCMSGCPIRQNIPEYLRLYQKGKFAEALQVIHERNAMPHITGYICESPCEGKCARLDYEVPLAIREVKKSAAEQGHGRYLKMLETESVSNSRVAVIGAGAAGVSASLQLRRAGFEVTVFDKEQKGGGLVRYVIPGFRLPDKAIDDDMELLKQSGINFEMGREVNVDELIEDGYKYIVVAIGAGKSKMINLGNDERVVPALDFLRAYKAGTEHYNYRKIVVTGGGNSAMDSARAAIRLPGVEEVELVYRRTEAEMPADREEYENALKDGVKFRFLLQPEVYRDGKLVCRQMKLGEIDETGRAKPEKANVEPVEIATDLVIMAIGEELDQEYMESNRLIAGDNCQTNRRNVYLAGDAWRGSSSVVEAMSDGITVAEQIIKCEQMEAKGGLQSKTGKSREEEIFRVKGERGKIKEKQDKLDLEASRCLGCDIWCSKCVEVCPNRANIAIKVASGHLRDPYQIVHLDWLCNECGNCETFCPWHGKPYKDKFTLFSDEKSFEKSDSDGVYLRTANSGELREEGRCGTFIIKSGFWAKDADGGDIILREETKAMITALVEYGYLRRLGE